MMLGLHLNYFHWLLLMLCKCWVGRQEGGQVGKNDMTSLGVKRGCGSSRQVGEKGVKVISKFPKKTTNKKKTKKKVNTKKVNKSQHTYNHQMRNPTLSNGQNSQLVCWWVLVHVGLSSPHVSHWLAIPQQIDLQEGKQITQYVLLRNQIMQIVTK